MVRALAGDSTITMGLDKSYDRFLQRGDAPDAPKP